MLNLTDKIEYYELKWFDGQLLHIMPVTYMTQRKFMALEKEDDYVKAFDTMIEALLGILNSNIEGREFTLEDVQSLPFNVIQLIITDYMGVLGKDLGE